MNYDDEALAETLDNEDLEIIEGAINQLMAFLNANLNCDKIDTLLACWSFFNMALLALQKTNPNENVQISMNRITIFQKEKVNEVLKDYL